MLLINATDTDIEQSTQQQTEFLLPAKNFSQKKVTKLFSSNMSLLTKVYSFKVFHVSKITGIILSERGMYEIFPLDILFHASQNHLTINIEVLLFQNMH